MTKENQAQFQVVLSRLEKAHEELKKNHMAFKELQKIRFLQEIIKEQIRNEDTHHPVR